MTIFVYLRHATYYQTVDDSTLTTACMTVSGTSRTKRVYRHCVPQEQVKDFTPKQTQVGNKDSSQCRRNVWLNNWKCDVVCIEKII